MSTAELSIPSSGSGEAPADGAASAWEQLRQRYVAIAIVALVHVLVLWVFGSGIRPGPAVPSVRSDELQVRILSPNLGPPVAPYPSLDWTFDTPAEVLVPEPQIVIAPDQEAGEGIVGRGITQRLAPRLDPKHVNARPELPHTMGGAIGAISVELRILVLPDGSVGDAKVVRSAGEADIDRLAIETVRNSWHYLPASINGKPVGAWTTVIIRFAAF